MSPFGLRGKIAIVTGASRRTARRAERNTSAISDDEEVRVERCVHSPNEGQPWGGPP